MTGLSDTSTVITTTAPRNGAVSPTSLSTTTRDEVDTIARAAAKAFDEFAGWSREQRAVLLESVAAQLESGRAELVATADIETGLGRPRLDGELTRSIYQLRLFADAVRDGGYLEAALDHAGDTPLGPAPDVRRMLVPLGPVAVFGASNFPFAFSVVGGDTASALAAGCPVVLKAHESHPLTSERSFGVLRDSLAKAGAPRATAGVVYGQDAGVALVAHPSIRAVGLTGSMSAARALRAVIDARDEPIPFFGELSSLNPVIVTEAAARARVDEIADGLYLSVTGSSGQLCTKPGIALIPADANGDAIVSALADRISGTAPTVMLNRRIRDSYDAVRQRLLNAGTSTRASGTATPSHPGLTVAPTVLEVSAKDFTSRLCDEAFGPLVLVVRYGARADALEVMAKLPGSLTATLQGQPEEPDLPSLLQLLASQAGRVIFNGYPTGVRVSWAQHHGGPWPATNTQHTSVGVTAIRRWLRPVAWQNVPDALLPYELRELNDVVPRRVDGRLHLPTSALSPNEVTGSHDALPAARAAGQGRT